MDGDMLEEKDTGIKNIDFEKQESPDNIVSVSAIAEAGKELEIEVGDLVEKDLTFEEQNNPTLIQNRKENIKKSSENISKKALSTKVGLFLANASLFISIATGCTVAQIKASAPIEPVEIPKATQVIPNEVDEETPKIEPELEASMESSDSIDEGGTVIPEIVLNPEQIKEQRLNEIAEVVKENDNIFTIEQLNEYLQKYGTGWEGGIEGWIDYYKGANLPFKYFFVKKSYKDSGVFLTSRPFLNSRGMTMRDMNNFPTPEVTNEEMLGRITEAIYIDLYPKNGNGRDKLWEDIAGKYTVIVYLSEEMCEDGVLRDIARLNIGGYFNYDEKGMVKYISPEKAKSYNFSDEELALMKQGYTTFIHIPYKGVIGAGKSESGLPVDGS